MGEEAVEEVSELVADKEEAVAGHRGAGLEAGEEAGAAAVEEVVVSVVDGVTLARAVSRGAVVVVAEVGAASAEAGNVA